MSVTYVCPACSTEIEVQVQLHRPAVTSGPADNWCDSEGGEIDPDYCPECGLAIPVNIVHDLAIEAVKDAIVDRAYERWKESLL